MSGPARFPLLPCRLPHWARGSLRAKFALLFVVVSLLPLGMMAFLNIRQASDRLERGAQDLMAARADQLAREIDAMHAGYRRSAQRTARLPLTREFCSAVPDQREALQQRAHGTLAAFAAIQPEVRGAAFLDEHGTVIAATEDALVGTTFSSRRSIQAALGGESVVSGVFVSGAATGGVPTVAYVEPVRDESSRVVCVVGLLVRAHVFERHLAVANNLAGPGSFVVLYDASGIRIAHSFGGDLQFRPAGPLAPAEIEAEAADARFGPDTRALLGDVKAEPEHFARARAALVDPAPFRAYSPANGKWNLGVARRLAIAPWTVVFHLPEDHLAAQVAATLRDGVLLALATIAVALAAGIAFSSAILARVRALTAATAALARGEDGVRLPAQPGDELSRLMLAFNTMAQRLQQQARSLRDSHAQLEQRVRERTGLVHAIIDNSPAVITVKDVEGRYLMVNERFCREQGVSKFEVIGLRTRDLFDADTAVALDRLDAQVLEDGWTRSQEQVVRVAGGQRTYLAVKCALHDDAGRVYGVAEVATDITERKAAEARQAHLHAALGQAYEELRRSQQAALQRERLRALGAMASGIAHDINNAMSPAALYVESLLDTEPSLSRAARERLEVVGRAIDDVAATVGRLREFCRKGDDTAVLAPTRVNALVPQVVALTQVRWSDRPPGRTIVLDTDLAPGLPQVAAVGSELREALTNLVFNAVDAMPEGGRIDVRSWRPDPRHVAIEVADTGVGMDEATRRNCLEPFFTTKGERGTGLGLAMVYGFAQRHNAAIEIDSEPGRGTAVRLVFPALADGPAAPEGAPAAGDGVHRELSRA